MSSNPQQQAVELIAAFFAVRFVDSVWAPHLDRLATQLAARFADAGLLCSSPDVQPQEQDGSLRSEPAALGEDSAVYIRLSNRAVNKTLNGYLDSVNIDVDDYDEPVGVEVLGAIEVTIDGQVVGRD